MIIKIIKIAILVLILGHDCKPTEVCNINDSDSPCGLNNILVQTDCTVTSTPPSKPQNLSGSPNNGQIVLNWNQQTGSGSLSSASLTCASPYSLLCIEQ